MAGRREAGVGVRAQPVEDRAGRRRRSCRCRSGRRRGRRGLRGRAGWPRSGRVWGRCSLPRRRCGGDRPRGRACRRSSGLLPGIPSRPGAGSSRRQGPDRRRGTERRSRAARSIPEIGGAPVRPPVRRRPAQRMVGVAGAPDRAILARRPPKGRPDRQAQPKTAAPHGRTPVISSGHRTRRLPDRLTRSLARNGRSPIAPCDPSRATAPHCRRRHHRPSSRSSARCSGREEARVLPFHTSGAQRASSTSRLRLFVLPLLALALAVGSAAFQPQATGRRLRGQGRHRRRPRRRPTPPGTSATPGATPRTARSLGASVDRDLQPQRHLVAGEDRRRGRQHLHLPRPRQRLPEPVRRLPRRRRRTGWGSTRRPATATTTSSTTARRYVKTYLDVRQERRRAAEPPLLRVRATPSPAGRNPTKSVAKHAGRLLRRRVPPGRRPGRLRERHGQPDVDHPPAADDRATPSAQIFQDGPGLLGSRGLPASPRSGPRATRRGWTRMRPAATTTRWSGGSR